MSTVTHIIHNQMFQHTPLKYYLILLRWTWTKTAKGIIKLKNILNPFSIEHKSATTEQHTPLHPTVTSHEYVQLQGNKRSNKRDYENIVHSLVQVVRSVKEQGRTDPSILHLTISKVIPEVPWIFVHLEHRSTVLSDQHVSPNQFHSCS